MSIYSIPTLLGAIFVFFLGLFVFVRNPKSPMYRAFFFLTFCLFLWLFSYTITYSTFSKFVAFVFCRLACTSVMFTTSAIYLFVALYLNKFQEERTWIYFSFGVMIALFPFFVFTKMFLDDPYRYSWGYYSKAGPLHPFYLALFFAIWVKGLFMFFDKNMWLKASQFTKNRLKYILAMYFLATLGSIDYLQKYGIDFYPFGWLFEVLFSIITAIAIVKYSLMDIKIALTRTSIFVFVYSLVLGIPFAIAFGWKERLIYIIGDNWWLVPLISSTVLATAGPFIYLYIQKRAEARLFQEQKRYQSTLRQASSGMGRIKDLSRLVNLIVHIVSRTVRLEHTLVYMFDSGSKLYQLRASRSRSARFKAQDAIDNNSAIVKRLVRSRNPIVYEEIKQQTQDYGDMNLARLESDLAVVNAELVVPCFIDDKLLAVIVLGKKVSNDLFSESDLAVFSILANQAALAMENAIFYEEMKNTHAQLMKAEKMATIGTMADGLSHQINNRLHALGFIAGDALDTIKLKKDVLMSSEVKEIMIDLEHALHRIEDNVTQGGEIVRGLLKYTRKGEEGFSEIEFDQLINAAMEMTQFKIKPGEIQILKEYGKDVPKINGNFTQLQEVFFNLIDNAYDAMMQRKNELKEKGYSPTIKIFAEGDHNGKVNIRFEDNGVGIKEEDKTRLFTPFFTT
ncbi:MAG: GAF domain-containing protein, partial [Candidatus Omnitrophota bacterium]